MLNKLTKILDFKQNLFEDDDSKQKIADKKKEIIDEVDSIINSSFFKTIYHVQKTYKDIFEVTKENIDKDLNEMVIFEFDEYKEEILEYIKNEFKNISETIIESLPVVEKEEVKEEK